MYQVSEYERSMKIQLHREHPISNMVDIRLCVRLIEGIV